MRYSRGVLLLVLALVFIVTPAHAKDVRKDYAESFDVHQGMTLQLVHGDGQVTIMPTDDDILDIKIRYRAKHTRVGVGDNADFDVEFKQQGDVIRVVGREKGSFVIGLSFFENHEYTYTIKAPPYLNLDLNGDDGCVSIDGWQGNISCELDDGDLELNDIHTEMVEIDLEDGDLVIDGFSGELDVKIDDGDVNLIAVNSSNCRVALADGRLNISKSAGVFDLEADDGDIEIRRTQATSVIAQVEDGDVVLDLDGSGSINLDLESSDGDIRVNLTKGLTAEYHIETDDGRIKLAVPDAAIDVKRKHRASGQLGNGDGEIRIQTEDGAVHFRVNG